MRVTTVTWLCVELSICLVDLGVLLLQERQSSVEVLLLLGVQLLNTGRNKASKEGVDSKK